MKNVFAVIGGIGVLAFLITSCGAMNDGSSGKSSTPAAKVQANNDQVRGYELAQEAGRVLRSAQSEVEAASNSSSVAEVCSHLPALQAKTRRVDGIIAELYTLDLTSEQDAKLQVLADTFEPVHEQMPLLASTC